MRPGAQAAALDFSHSASVAQTNVFQPLPVDMSVVLLTTVPPGPQQWEASMKQLPEAMGTEQGQPKAF